MIKGIPVLHAVDFFETVECLVLSNQFFYEQLCARMVAMKVILTGKQKII